MIPSLGKYFQMSKRLILKRSEKLKLEEKEALDIMLLYIDDLRQACKLKESLYYLPITSFSVQRKDFY